MDCLVGQGVGVICEVIDEATALIADHVEGGRHTPDETIRRLWSLLHEQSLIEAMHAVGHFPANTPPPSVTLADH
jgi:hypothetical protein